MRQKLIILASLIGICGFFIYLSCCDDCPTCADEPELPPLGNYRCYIWDTYNNIIFSIDTPADTIIDSVHTDLAGYDFFVAPGGERLLALNSATQTTEILSTADLSHIGSLDLYGDFYFDGEDNYGVYYSLLNDKTYFIDPTTFALLDSIPRGIRYGCLDTVENVFFGSKMETDSAGSAIEGNVIFKIDCDTRELVDSFVVHTDDTQMPVRVYRIAYKRGTEELYFHGAEYADYSCLYRYETGTGDIKRIIRTRGPFGDVSISLGRNELYMSDPGKPVFGIPPLEYFMIFDIESDELLAAVPSIVYPELTFILPGRGLIRPTPDGRRLYVGGESYTGYGPAVVIDLEERKIIKAFDLFDDTYCALIAIGPSI